MKVKDILKQKGPEVITIWEDKSIISAVETMVQNKIGALLVMDEKGMITGIISERDILRVIHFHLDKLREMKVREAMVKRVIIGDPGDTLEYIENIMTDNKIRHVPIILNERLVGIISIGDIVKAVSKSIKTENRYLKDYIEGKYIA